MGISPRGPILWEVWKEECLAKEAEVWQLSMEGKQKNVLTQSSEKRDISKCSVISSVLERLAIECPFIHCLWSDLDHQSTKKTSIIEEVYVFAGANWHGLGVSKMIVIHFNISTRRFTKLLHLILWMTFWGWAAIWHWVSFFSRTWWFTFFNGDVRRGST